MYGLEAISYANGWAMAAVGASIVITGLSVLAFLISQLHRLVSLFENTDTILDDELNSGKESKKIVPEKLSDELGEASKVYMSFTNQLGDNFQLADLYRLSNEVGLPHPHISIRNFRASGVLISAGEGRFSWKSISV